ncbi:hypothetical protein BCV70DRAFT_34886 [Testicularia cyperi]|uniref:Uncharacterized protein n=1 Tax=Testicularia cyperi TaxID=1882483 RepID=A0A317XLJ3_9BASI|nr:hypothetical protein BCV70DRAFT_34886 [Testicularia cyperi]
MVLHSEQEIIVCRVSYERHDPGLLAVDGWKRWPALLRYWPYLSFRSETSGVSKRWPSPVGHPPRCGQYQLNSKCSYSIVVFGSLTATLSAQALSWRKRTMRSYILPHRPCRLSLCLERTDPSLRGSCVSSQHREASVRAPSVREIRGGACRPPSQGTCTNLERGRHRRGRT